MRKNLKQPYVGTATTDHEEVMIFAEVLALLTSVRAHSYQGVRLWCSVDCVNWIKYGKHCSVGTHEFMPSGNLRFMHVDSVNVAVSFTIYNKLMNTLIWQV